MDCETCDLDGTVPTDLDATNARVCPECGREVRALVDGVTPLATLDPEAYDQLEAILRDGVVREYPPPYTQSRTLTSDERRGMLDQLPGLVPVYRCTCGDAVCLTYNFVPRAEIRDRWVITFDVAGIAVLELSEDDRILAFECITDTSKMS